MVKNLALIKLTPEDIEKIEFLKGFAKTKTRTKTLLFALNKTYEIYKAMPKIENN